MVIFPLQPVSYAILGASAFSVSISSYRHVPPSAGWVLARAIAARDMTSFPGATFKQLLDICSASVGQLSMWSQGVTQSSGDVSAPACQIWPGFGMTAIDLGVLRAKFAQSLPT